MGETRNSDNLYFKSFNEKDFLEDLSKCKYVILNGGFTVISEALYLKKPILAIPVKEQFEQYFNALSIKKEGYGTYVKEIKVNDIEQFENNLFVYKNNLSKLEKWDDKELFELIEKLIRRYTKRVIKISN